MQRINQHAPIRPRYVDEYDKPLLYATMPQLHLGRYEVTKPHNMIAQMRLYRAVCQGDVPNYVGIGDLHQFIFWNCLDVSKNTMGATVIRSVLYNPRRLKGVTKDNDKACMIYSFEHLVELQYGLEWMICTWLRKFLNEQAARRGETRVFFGPEDMREELEFMSLLDTSEYMTDYENEVWKTSYEDPDWIRMIGDRNELSEIISLPNRKEEQAAKPAPLKSLGPVRRL